MFTEAACAYSLFMIIIGGAFSLGGKYAELGVPSIALGIWTMLLLIFAQLQGRL